MKPLLVMLLVAISVQAQSVADAARQERERQAKVKSTVIIKEEGPPVPADGKPNELPRLNLPAEPDPVGLWNARADELRNKIKDLQDQETALQLQQTNQQNQVYAPVVDPVLKDQAQADLTQTIQQLAKVREDLDLDKKELDAMLAEGPPKRGQLEPGQAQPPQPPEPQPPPEPKPQP
jgi:hypothetical protein